ncbi:MAG: DNA polymerase III subunit alpha [Thermodesulfobacteriota bacterium]
MIPLALYSHYSRLLGTASPAALCARARELGYRQLALTDLADLGGLWPFVTACAEHGITPLIGATLPAGSGVAAGTTLLAENEEGYRNLCRILTLFHRAPAAEHDQSTATHGSGLVLLCRDPARLRFFHDRGLTVAAALAVRPTGRNHRLRAAARRLGVPAAAVPDAFFPDAAGFSAHRLLRAIHHSTSLARLPAAATATADSWLAGPGEYMRRFAVWPEAVAATHAIAERCVFRRPAFGTVMPPWHGGDADAELRRRAWQGARRRYGGVVPAEVGSRLEHELAIITAMGFSSYFLTVRDIIPAAARTCGRGSGAASLVSYCLELTNVCPLTHNLYFERFLNPGRSDPPDLDIDFAWDERDGILADVLDRFGARAAMVCCHVLLQPRLAIREAARAWGLADGEIGRVTRKLPWLWRSEGDDFLSAIGRLPQLRATDLAPPWPAILHQAAGIVGCPRALSVHPGGVVITPHPVADYVPVQTTAKGVPVIQWDKDSAEDGGLVKIDLLGNRSLGVIRDAVAAVRAGGTTVDGPGWRPEEDQKTQRLLASGRTMGCFYIESPAMRLLQEKAGSGGFDKLVLHSSIIRPAANDFIREYLRRLHGGAWQHLHPLLAGVLDESFGIMVYQEDVSKVAVALAGFSHVDADRLRKILSKKDRQRRLADYARKFRDGCRRNGIDDDCIDRLWAMMMSFDGYSFCKPHSASYAKVSCQAAFLKAHYPAQFMAAVISNGGGYYSTFAYVSEARRLGLVLLGPDVEQSAVAWTGEGKRLRVGLMAIRGLGRKTAAAVVRERPYRDAADFLQRVRPDATEAAALADSGALDCFGLGRGQLAWLLAGRGRQSARQAELFAPAPVVLPRLPPLESRERLRREFRALGFLVHCHPMQLFAGRQELRGTVKAAALGRHPGRRVRFAGWLLTGKTVRTKHDEPMEFLTFEDETAPVETTFFPKVYAASCHLLAAGRPYLLDGRVENDFGALTLTVERLRPLAADRPSPPLPPSVFCATPEERRPPVTTEMLP